jgi:glucose-fructose oxidoreductase
MYKVGIIGYAQMHVLHIAEMFCKSGRIEWVGIADIQPTQPHNGELIKNFTRADVEQKLLAICGLTQAEADAATLIDKRPDVMVVCVENSRHAEIACQVLSQGIPVVLEKPMAATLSDALRMVRCARLHRTDLITNWPIAWLPAFHHAARLAREGLLGDIYKVNYRNPASMGSIGFSDMTEAECSREWWYKSDSGGGAMLDYCGYGCLLTRWIIGARAQTAVGMRANLHSRFADVEDYSAMLLQFDTAVGNIEGSWSSLNDGGIATGPVIFGSRGVLTAHRWDAKLKLYRDYHVNEPSEIIDPPALPANRANIALEVLHHLDTGEALSDVVDIPFNLDAMAALDAGIRSAVSGKREIVRSETIL